MNNSFYEDRLENIISSLEGLKKDDLEKLADKLCTMLSKSSSCNDFIHCFDDRNIECCNKCGSVKISKHGKTRKGQQRYRCSDCGHTFTSISDSVFSGTHKSTNQWKNFILYTLEGKSLRFCAEQCNISLPTSFSWRHKLLSALASEQFSDKLGGIIEVDEMFVPVSYKGNHKNSKKFTMPRPAYKRGTDNKSRSTKDKACVLCAVERNKGFSGLVTHRGALNSTILSSVFDNHITNDSIVITDESKALNKYFQAQAYLHKAMASSADGSSFKTVPVVDGPYHINNTNALHSRFRLFLRKFNGVASKHLNKYLSLFLWVENNFDKNSPSLDKMISFLSENPVYTSYKSITNTPMLAVMADDV